MALLPLRCGSWLPTGGTSVVAAGQPAPHVCERMRVPTLLLGLLAMTACASGGRGPMRSSNVLTREELETVQVSSVFDAVQRLRPQWLSRPQTPSGMPGSNPVLVYVDRHHMGTVDELRHITVDQVETLEFVSASDATTRYGTGNASGIIEVTTRRGR